METKKRTVQVQDHYNKDESLGVVIDIIELDDYSQSQYKETHYAIIRESQIERLKRQLTNGPANMNVTKVNRSGKDMEAEIYFSL